MRYKNKNLIIEDIGPEPNCNYPVEVGHYYSKIEELDEVYRKAKAFDDIVAAYEDNTGLGEHDEDLTDFEAIVDSIEHGIQMVGYRENEEEVE